MPVVLECRALARRYRNAGGLLEVLHGVDLRVGPGEIVAILGPSGSGKSTLIHLLAGLDAPDAGEVWWGDLAVHRRRPRDLAQERARALGLVFQNHYLLRELSLLENIMLPGSIRGRPDEARARGLLERVGLSGRMDALPGKVSGGERQRAAVARALALDPPLLLADEPTGSLDRDNARAVFELLVELARERGTAIVMVTHDDELVRPVPRRFHLEGGRLEPLPASS
ncbi:MAG TPA: ATP-binding cassette domain-containing protein [Trueperaceae bacterium]|nr:ATP-binding cassette domain-containing protein [Trueperaceae bacterium]